MNPIPSLSIIGAGGHAKVVIDACQRSLPNAIIQVFDQSLSKPKILGCPIHRYNRQAISTAPAHVAIGNNLTRARILQELLSHDLALLTVIHPTAIIASSAQIGAGCFIAAGAIIGPEAVIGQGVIINHNAVIDHECDIGHFAHIAPHATLGGNVTVGAYTLVGSSATLLPNLSLGDNVVVGSGAVVPALFVP